MESVAESTTSWGDLIGRSFWGINPPSFMVLSSTVLLPGYDHYPIREIEHSLRALKRKRRDIEYQPERFAETGRIPANLVAAKRSLLSNFPGKGHRAQWHERITELNQEMSSQLDSSRQELETARESLESMRREAMIWNSREHSFCVYPLDYLTDAYHSMLSHES